MVCAYGGGGAFVAMWRAAIKSCRLVIKTIDSYRWEA